MKLETGSRLAHYRLEAEVGSGGMGVVWKARDENLDEAVALKLLPWELARDQEAMDRLRDEARVLFSLTHEGIVRLRTLEKFEDVIFLVMEFLEGPTLSRLVRSRRKRGKRGLSPGEVIWALEQVADPLEYAHARGILHRDIKPANLMLTGNPMFELDRSAESLKLTDFGIAFVASTSLTHITGYRPFGTIPYMAPEVLIGGLPSRSSEVYALGASVYALVNGDPPFTHGDVTLQILEIEPPPLGSGHPGLDLAASRALAKKPGERPYSVGEFLSMVKSPSVQAAIPRERSERKPVRVDELSSDPVDAEGGRSTRLERGIRVWASGLAAIANVAAVAALLSNTPIHWAMAGAVALLEFWAGAALVGEYGHRRGWFRVGAMFLATGAVVLLIVGGRILLWAL